MNVDDGQSLLSSLKTIGPQILGTKQLALAFFAIQLYDHILTLPEEIELIWKTKFTLVTLLFFLNRYYALAAFCVYIAALLSPLFNPSVCKHFALFFPFAGGIMLTFVPNTVLALRVYALYQKRKLVAALLATYLIAELGVALWLYCTPGSHPLILPMSVQDDTTFHICIDAVADRLGNLRPAAFQIMQTVYDTGVFLSIIFRVILDKRCLKYGQDLQSLIALHSVIYYASLFSANLTWGMMILFAPDGLKYTAAIPTFVLACTMVNRITLSLRGFAYPRRDVGNESTLQILSEPRPGKTNSQMWTDAGITDIIHVDIETIELTVPQRPEMSRAADASV